MFLKIQYAFFFCAFVALGNCDYTYTQALTAEEQKAVVAAHNKIREETGYKLNPLTYNETLGNAAITAGYDCYYGHGLDNPYGENIYWGSAWSFDGTNIVTWVEKAVARWDSEKKFVEDGDVTGCAFSSCGHYSQVVWNNTREVGCAYIKNCEYYDEESDTTFPGANVYCEYYPPGNVRGQSVYNMS